MRHDVQTKSENCRTPPPASGETLSRRDIESPPLTWYKRSVDKTIRKFANFDEMKADEYRYWQSRPVHERVAAVAEPTEEGYKLKGFKPGAFRLDRTLVHFERAPR